MTIFTVHPGAPPLAPIARLPHFRTRSAKENSRFYRLLWGPLSVTKLPLFRTLSAKGNYLFHDPPRDACPLSPRHHLPGRYAGRKMAIFASCSAIPSPSPNCLLSGREARKKIAVFAVHSGTRPQRKIATLPDVKQEKNGRYGPLRGATPVFNAPPIWPLRATGNSRFAMSPRGTASCRRIATSRTLSTREPGRFYNPDRAPLSPNRRLSGR